MLSQPGLAILRMKPNKKRAFLFAYGLSCLLWAYQFGTQFSVVVAGLFFVGAAVSQAFIGPLAAIVSIVCFGSGSYFDATACICLALLLQPPQMRKDRVAACTILAALFWIGCVGVLVDRFNPCLIYTPGLYLVAGSLTAPCFFVYLSRFIGWPQSACTAIVTGLLILAVAPRVPRVVVGEWACKDCFHPVGGALEMYQTDHNGALPDKLGDVAPKYIRQLPHCPMSPQGLKYEKNAQSNAYTISCSGPHFSGLYSKDSGWVYNSFKGRIMLP